MTTKDEGASIIKTIIAFRNSTILRKMTARKAAANALICFELFPQVRASVTERPLSKSITDSGAYDVMKHHELEMEKVGVNDYSDYTLNLSLGEVDTINAAFTALAELMYDHDEIPVSGGKEAIDRIYNAISQEGVH